MNSKFDFSLRTLMVTFLMIVFDDLDQSFHRLRNSLSLFVIIVRTYSRNNCYIFLDHLHYLSYILYLLIQ